MRLSKASYFADFFVYPPAVALLMVAALWLGAPGSWKESLIACLAGIAVWTLLEYLIHRFVLHEVRYFAQMHDMHHADPAGFVGTPTWLSMCMICCGALLPLWWEAGLGRASGITAGSERQVGASSPSP